MLLIKKQAPKGKKYTYSDYLTWPEGERWELIEGIAYAKEGGCQAMSPAPSRRHQEIQMELSRVIANFLKGKSCKVYTAPFDVRLNRLSKSEKRIQTVVQPDITVICDHSKLDDKGCLGSPDWIVEIVSPSSGPMDHVKKLNLYEQHGIKEYWIVHPFEETVMSFQLDDNGLYGRPAAYTSEDKAPVGIFRGELIIELQDVFAQ